MQRPGPRRSSTARTRPASGQSTETRSDHRACRRPEQPSPTTNRPVITSTATRVEATQRIIGTIGPSSRAFDAVESSDGRRVYGGEGPCQCNTLTIKAKSSYDSSVKTPGFEARMIRSMTGFGRGEASDARLVVSVEARSVNHRHLGHRGSPSPRPGQLGAGCAASHPGSRVERGRVDVAVQLSSVPGVPLQQIRVDHALARAWVSEARDLREALGLASDVSLAWILRAPRRGARRGHRRRGVAGLARRGRRP